MRRLKLSGAALIGCALIALSPASAVAAKATRSKPGVLADCEQTGRLTYHYSVAQLEQAQKAMPSTAAEYGSCPQVVQDQLYREEGKRHAGDGSVTSATGGSNPALLVFLIVVVVVGIVTVGGFLYARRRGGGGDPEEPPPPTAQQPAS